MPNLQNEKMLKNIYVTGVTLYAVSLVIIIRI